MTDIKLTERQRKQLLWLMECETLGIRTAWRIGAMSNERLAELNLVVRREISRRGHRCLFARLTPKGRKIAIQLATQE